MADTRFQKGEHRSPATEFKPGQHWRKPQAFRDREYLELEYVNKGRSSGEIAREFGVTETAIFFWLRKHGIPRRSVSEARALKHWGVVGEANWMHGRRGEKSPAWKGGISPERATFYNTDEWKATASFVLSRDKGICRCCGLIPDEGSRAIHIHHIAPFKITRLRADPSNLLLLCAMCHGWVHSHKNVTKAFISEVAE